MTYPTYHDCSFQFLSDVFFFQHCTLCRSHQKDTASPWPGMDFGAFNGRDAERTKWVGIPMSSPCGAKTLTAR